MRITTILGSPRSRGNTASLLEIVEQRLQAAQHEVSRFNVARMNVSGCLGCMKCQHSRTACVQKDDLVSIFSSMSSSEVILYATPNYGWGPTAQLKALLDRQLSLLTGYGTPQAGSLLAGKSLALLVTSAGPWQDNSELLHRPFQKMVASLDCTSLGTFHVPGTFDPEAVAKLGPAIADDLLRALRTQTGAGIVHV